MSCSNQSSSLPRTGHRLSARKQWPQWRAAALLLFFTPSVAGAEPSPTASAEQCLDAYTEGQRARKSGEFGRARELLAACGGATCPAALHGDCQRWLTEVEAATPTAVFRVLSPNGEEIHDAQLSVNEAPAVMLDGRAIQFDPGEHELEFRAPGFQPLRRRQSFVEGQKLVSHTVELQPLVAGEVSPAASPTPLKDSALDDSLTTETSPGTNLPLWLGIGVAAVGAGGFTYFGLTAREDEKALSSCSPNCANARVEGVERNYLLANISLGVGAVGLLGAVAWLVFAPDEPNATGSTAPGTNWRLHLGANSAALSGRF